MTEAEALEKIKQIEQKVRDALLVETTTIRTKNTVTIASRHPVRHVQIVLRIYKSISEILTGFDVDCSCAAYDGNQVYASPRALAAYMTQINSVDLTRRSPSYENRLSKYAQRGFEVYWPLLDREKVDPTIFERSFLRTEGLARLLILEKLPRSEDREAYLDQRREERGRPAANRSRMRKRLEPGNIKNDHENEIAEWDVDEEASNYHSVSIPYGPNYHARKIEKLLFTKDLLLNSEWNKPKDREVNLHRHPVFFGSVDDVIHDCCGFCPKPSTIEEEEVAEEENKTFVSGEVSFLKDDPGRQAIGSFHPLTDDDWTTMAYVGNTALLCQAIVDGDLDYVQSWLAKEGNDPNTRDFTGRAPLHLAVSNSTIEVVQALIDAGARLVARLVDGKTALHLAAMRGQVDMVSALLRKSEANEEEEEEKIDARRAARKAAKETSAGDVQMQDANDSPAKLRSTDSDIEMIEQSDAETDVIDQTTENSMVDIKHPSANVDDQVLAKEEKEDEPDVYDINVTAWDTAVSPLHLAIAKGHTEVVKFLVSDAGADLLLPIKLFNDHDKSARAAILTLVLALQLPTKQAEEMARTLIQLGASSAQASIDQTTVLQCCVADTPDMLETLGDADMAGVMRAINHLSVSGYKWNPDVSSPFMTAIQAKDSATALRLLELGAKPEIDFAAYMKAYQTQYDPPKDSKQNKRNFQESHTQPVLTAVSQELPLLAKKLVEEYSIDPNTLHPDGHRVLESSYTRRHTKGRSLLDVVTNKLKTLRDWKHDPKQPTAPTPLKADDEYMSDFESGTYAFWSATKQLEAAKDRYRRDLKTYEKQLEDSRDRTGVAEKQEAINLLIGDFEQLEEKLIAKGAKSFYDLFPDVDKPEKRPDYGYSHHRNRDDPKEFDVELKFQLGDLTEQTQKRYENLFEAAWRGAVKEVKEFTLIAWQDEKGEDRPPCKIAVQDQHNMSPFAIATLRGHTELSNTIMEIANAQHYKADPPKERQYGIEPGDSDEESAESDDEDIHLYSEIVDDEFTIENVGEVSMQVKSHILPTTMLMWSSDAIHDFTHRKEALIKAGNSTLPLRATGSPNTPAGKRTNTGTIKPPSPPADSAEVCKKRIPEPNNLLRFAIYTNHSNLLKSLLELGTHYTSAQPGNNDDDDEVRKIFTISDRDFEYAIDIGHAHLLSEIITVSGAGIPLNSMAKKYGADLQEKPRYYQGLTVHGRKRKDWAQRGYDDVSYADMRSYNPPLLKAAHFASQEVIEWLLSDSPVRCYNTFAEANKDDKRLKQLGLSKTGFQGTVEKFLNARSHTVIHCCIAGEYTAEAESLLRYLLEAMPELLEAKSMEGFTPLHVAFELYREDWARLLIETGADQTCREKSGKNLLHSLLDRQNGIAKEKHVDQLKRMLDLVDKRVLPSLFVERVIGSSTPMQSWLNGGGSHGDVEDQVLKLLLEYGGGQELSFISGGGDTPLHHTVKQGNLALTKVILDHDATLLNRENATGRTPFEMAEDASISGLCSHPPPMPREGHNFQHRRAVRLGLPTNWDMDLANRGASDFVKDSRTAEPSARTKNWNLLRETRARLEKEGKWKRKLVTLNEANEVARRLAAKKSGSRMREDEGDNESEASDEYEAQADEVATYMSQAKRG